LIIFFAIEYSDVIEIMIELIEFRMNSISDSSSGASLDYRLLMNKGAIMGFSEKPLLGVGYANMRLLWSHFGIYSIPDDLRPHNTYLSMLASGGIFTLILFIYVFYLPLYKILRKLPLRNMQLVFLWGLMTYLSLFFVYISPLNQENNVLMFLFYGVTMGYLDDKLKKQNA
jgi:O-antigen ligase